MTTIYKTETREVRVPDCDKCDGCGEREPVDGWTDPEWKAKFDYADDYDLGSSGGFVASDSSHCYEDYESRRLELDFCPTCRNRILGFITTELRGGVDLEWTGR